MSLAGEAARRDFVVAIGQQLDDYAKPAGRLVWRDLLNAVNDGASEVESTPAKARTD